MNCSEFEAAVDQLVESRGRDLSGDAAVHQRTCPACGRLWQDTCLLEAAITAWRPVETPVAMTDRVMQGLFADASPAKVVMLPDSSAGQTSAGRWVVAASVACVLLAGWMAARNSDDGRSARLASGVHRGVLIEQTPVVAALPAEVSQSVTALLTDLNTEYRGLAAETSATARDIAAVLPSPILWPDPVSTTPAEEEPSPSTGTVIGRSIGDQIGQAIGFLWQTVPGELPSG